jgi:hypothetical protein
MKDASEGDEVAGSILPTEPGLSDRPVSRKNAVAVRTQIVETACVVRYE